MPKKKGKTANLMYENQIFQQGYTHILGMDEAGRGAWAGPVAVGAACLPLDVKNLRKTLGDVRDSKVMTPRQRERAAEKIKEYAIAWGVGAASNIEIDEIGIVAATKLAMLRALEDTTRRFPDFKPHCLFLAALVWPEMVDKIPQITIVDGDARSLTIAAASVIARTWRDSLMVTLDEDYPQYGFAGHKGYGASNHRNALNEHGICNLHRLSFEPMASLPRP